MSPVFGLLLHQLQSARTRYDLLCIEGIARALRIFLGLDRAPQYKLKYPARGEADLVTATIAPEVCCHAHGHLKLILTSRRQNKFGHTLHVPYYETSILLNCLTTPSSTCKTSYIRISVEGAYSSPSAHMTWIPSVHRSATKRDRRKTSSLCRSTKTRRIQRRSS